jgi:hypothetical protein
MPGDDRRGRVSLEEDRRILAGGNRNLKGVVSSLRLVILSQALSEAVRLYSHNRIRLLVEVGWAPESFYGNTVFLDPVRLTSEMTLANIGEELRQSGSFLEGGGLKNRVKFLFLFFKPGAATGERSTHTPQPVS